jgi:4'-phosphopantetheinyl transferase
MTNHEQQWHQRIPEKPMASDQVHIWRIPLDVNVQEPERLLAHLSGDEVLRADRFHFENDRNHFVAARGGLRHILGHHLHLDPRNIVFEYNDNGKPQLAADSGSNGLQFNLSHSGALALCAITLHRNIGVDIEYIRRDVAVEQIARQFFSQGEIILLEATDQHMRYETFFRYWTRKEAFLKARGDGLSFPMHMVDVSGINGGSFLPLPLFNDEKQTNHWYIQDLFPGDAYAAAVAVEGSGSELSCSCYSL